MHQEVPFERVVEEVGAERDISRNPLFQVLFVLQNVPRQVIQLPDLSLTAVELNRSATRFDLELHVWEQAEGLKLVWIYSTQLFEAESIRRMADRFQLLLEEIRLNPERPVSDLQFLTEAERRQMLFDWNRTSRFFQPLECLHHGFEAQAELTPQSIALHDGERSLSYAELNERADQLASYLCSLGVTAEDLVGVMMQRNIEMVVALLGVLKAGAAYVPIDPSYPPARQRVIMEDARFKVVLTERELKSTVAECSAALLCLDEQWDEVARCEPGRRLGGASRENLAYVIYTSGSTGRPKGVAIEHRSAANFVRWSVEKFGTRDLSVVLFATSICFDLSVFELFAPLTCGGQVVIAENALQLSSLAAANRVRLINSVPSAVSALVQLKAVPEGVRVVNLAGEALRRSLVEELYRSSRVEEVYNLYGPTEYTTYATCAAVGRDDSGEPNIGRPIANTEVYVLDERQQLAGVGVVGEIYIGGAGLARGYLNRAEQTARRFIPHPFSQEEGARLYRTGDLGRWLAGGELEYLGRVDEQVKIRGYRIELGEVEAVLQEHERVRECVAAMREEPGGDKRLLAYVVPRLSSSDDQQKQRPDEPRPPVLPAEERAFAEQVSKWELVWDETYRQPPPVLDPRFNIVGWVSSYTGLPIPAEQMREWLDQTVERILALRPARLLEIGAGTGLLLFRLAPLCKQYYATDFSAAALQYLEEQLEQSELPQVTLLHRRAEDFTELEREAFDTVVLNSVVQYFPGVDYLLRVLERAVKAVRAGGAVFVGDVRSLPLLEAFHASVQLRQAASALTGAQLRQLVKKRVNEEQELVISPAFFYALQQYLPEIAGVEVKLKRGRFRNELTRFRYDAILHVGPRERRRAEAGATVLEWETERLTLQELRRLLIESEPEMVRLKGVPNARLEEEKRTLEWLANGRGAETVGQWRSALREQQSEMASGSVEPEEIWALGAELPYRVEINYGPEASGDGRFDVLLRRRVEGADDVGMGPRLSEAAEASHGALALGPGEKPGPVWNQYANNPLWANLERNLARELRRFMAQKLPDYMIPAAFIILDALPLTPNGKVDRRALPAPGQARPELEQGFVPPRTGMEEKLASIWSQVLGLERVGVFDNFFELGGDSILSIQVIARAHEQGIQLTPRQLFQNQTVAALGAVAATALRVEAEQDLVTGVFPLTPWQRRFFERGIPLEPDWKGCAQLFIADMREPLDASLLEQAVLHLFMQHDASRLRFVKGEGSWQQVNLGSEGSAPLLRLDLSCCAEDERRAAMEAFVLELEASLASGPLAQVAVVEMGAGKAARLLLMTSSLVFDERSVEILLEDLERAYRQLRRGEAVALGAKTNSFKQWVELLMDYRHAAELRRESSYWMRQSTNSIAELPSELFVKDRGAGGQSAGAAARQLTLSLDAAETRALLEEVPRAYRTELREVLLTALAEALINWANGAAVLVDLEGEARRGPFEGCDFSRTAGQFKTSFPVLLELEDGTSPGSALQTIKEKLRGIPSGGLGYGLLRYAVEEQEVREQLASLPQAQIIFRLGSPGAALSAGASLFDMVEKRAFAPPAAPGRYLLEVGAELDRERLTITWRYDEQRVRAGAVSSLAEEMMAALRRLIAHCLSPGAGGYSLSDFKEFKWDALHLAEITDLIEKSTGTAREALLDGRIEDLYPLSSAQEGILFHTLREAESNLYLHQFNVLLEGRLDVGCFERAWQKVADRHSILRTSFLWEGLKEPVQVVERGVRLQMQIEDWRHCAKAEREARLAAFLEADGRRSFSLMDAPLMRLALLRLEEQSYHFIWTHHHLLLDGWSLNLVLREVLDCYEAYRRGEEPALMSPQPYRNYIAWLKRKLRPEERAKSETFWRTKLAGLNRPTTLGRRAAASHEQAERRYGDEHFRLSKQATAALRAVAQQHQLTLSTVAQGIWALLLGRYSGEEDVVFGSVVSGRPAQLAGVESMVGLFINTLPVRARFDGEEWLLRWLRQLQEQEAEMREHQHTPLVDVHGWSDVPRTEPLFESIVSVDNYPVDLLSEEVNDELRVREVRARQRSNYPLAVVVVPGIELSVRISYDCRRFRSEMINHLLDNYARLLNKVVSHPHATLNTLQLIKEEEKKLVRRVTRIASLDESFDFQ
jgi:amino acid adenylation domain-containing protein/non-ribosomal peptide synthase protein (TIGR01720 family)